MDIVSIGGMRLRHWTLYFRILWQTFAALRQAKATPGCVTVRTFRDGNVYFALSVWQDEAAMHHYAKSGAHGALMPRASQAMVSFYNHKYRSVSVPDNAEAAREWRAQPRSKAVEAAA